MSCQPAHPLLTLPRNHLRRTIAALGSWLNRKGGILLLSVLCGGLLLSPWTAQAVERFPPPEFESDYRMPSPTTPAPRAGAMEYVDLAVFVSALGFATYLVHRKRSRRWVQGLTLFSVLYFGFYRKGCICAVGSIQDVTLAVFNHGYAVPVTVILFFLLPLIFTLFWGRTFCAAVCPLGAIQDLVVVRPVKIVSWLTQSLAVIPFIYLGAAVLFAATGSLFLICQYDPFVAFFRRSGSLPMFVFGGSLLALGMFVGRPYCRFLCPYGALLSLFSRFAKWNVTLSPSDCIKCQICEVACPFDAIRDPSPTTATGTHGKLIVYLALLLALAAGGAWLGHRLSPALARLNKTVVLAEQVALEDRGTQAVPTDASTAFRQTGQPVEKLYERALAIRREFALGSALLGVFVGLAFGFKLVGLLLPGHYLTYEPDRADCVACARCFPYCPKEIGRQRQCDRKECQAAAQLATKPTQG